MRFLDGKNFLIHPSLLMKFTDSSGTDPFQNLAFAEILADYSGCYCPKHCLDRNTAQYYRCVGNKRRVSGCALPGNATGQRRLRDGAIVRYRRKPEEGPSFFLFRCTVGRNSSRWRNNVWLSIRRLNIEGCTILAATIRMEH